MGREYKKPPVVEVVCELRASEDTEWDTTVAGLVYSKIKDDFPIKEERVVADFKVAAGKNGFEQSFIENKHAIFLKNDKNTFLEVGPRLLSVHNLRAYAKWEYLQSVIENAFDVLLSVVDFKNVMRIGLRYINRIIIPEKVEDLSNFFSFRPYLGGDLPEVFTSFIVGCQFPFNNERDYCKVQLTSPLGTPSDKSVFLFDLDFYLREPQTIPVTDINDWVSEAHDQIETLFEGCINDRLRDIFEEIK